MYAVVGCGECDALWVVEGEPETTGCPRCGRRHRFDRLRRFAETDDEHGARRARTAMLAERSGEADTLEELGGVDALERGAEDAGVGDEEYLAGAGVDADAVEAAGARAPRGSRAARTGRAEAVREALRELDAPTEADVVAFAGERGVPPEATRRLLDRMVRAGEASEDRGRYRPV